MKHTYQYKRIDFSASEFFRIFSYVDSNVIDLISVKLFNIS